MTAPPRGAAPDEATSASEGTAWHRLHPRMLLIHPIIEVGRALPALVGVFLAGRAQGNNYWALGAAAIVAVLSISRWFTTRLRIDADSVQLRHGLLRRRTVTTARDRIRTVDVTANPLHRMLGLARVVIGTGMNDRRGGGRLVLDGLTLPTATALRDDLLHQRPANFAAVTGPAAAQATDASELARLDRRWIRFAPFTLSGVVTGLVVWGFYWRVQGESGLNFARSGPLRAVTRTLRAMPVAAEVLVVVGALVAFVAITSTAGYVLAFWNFRLRRTAGGTLEVTRGLLTTRATSIEPRRLVGVALSDPLPLRVVGAARTTAIATGLRVGRGTERGGEVLLPPAPLRDAERVAAIVLDAGAALQSPLQARGPAARRRRLLRACAAGALLCGLTAWAWSAGAPLWLFVVGVIALAASIPLGVDRYRNLGHRMTGDALVVAHGSLVRRKAVIEDAAVIGWNLRSSFFQQRAGLMTLTATTAAGRQGYAVIDVDRAEGLAVADHVTPGLLDQFRPGQHTMV
ncbi:MAG TPA: PH domain-containing protein [Jatrophihabitans sp.]|nr:PH domain-containing protein [Jatrophihabitans sp.]